jgi:two-component system, sensor histidine kinase and response regulator
MHSPVKKILVIDDTDDVRAVVVRSLKEAGFTTLEAADATEAVKLCVTASPDLVLCDVNLPDMDGYQTLAAIREIPHFAMVPFILMTGSPDIHAFRRGMSSGADDFLAKPFTADELVQSVVSRLVRQMELEYEASERAKEVRAAAVHQYSEELSDPINGLLGAVTSIMVDYACVRPEAASDGARQINESAQRLNQLAQRWAG